MTYKDEVLRRHPHSIRMDCFGGVLGCPGEYFLGAPESGNCGKIIAEENCEKCWNTEIPIPTNADRIRAMSDEELAVLFADDERACPPKHPHCSKYVDKCNGCLLEWLQQPAKEE